jgi:hypothetical protein
MFSTGTSIFWLHADSNLVVSDEAGFMSAHSKVDTESECWLALLLCDRTDCEVASEGLARVYDFDLTKKALRVQTGSSDRIVVMCMQSRLSV